MSRAAVILLLLMGSGRGKLVASSADHEGQCWHAVHTCLFKSAAGTGTPWEPCWLRCVCTGHLSHICLKTEFCDNPKFPYRCLCGGNSKGNIPRFCNLHKKNSRDDVKWWDRLRNIF